MLKQHRATLNNNHDFLVNEMPMDAVLEALRPVDILTWHDMDQLRTLRHQGRRALARYLLGVLPYRGPNAFNALLEALQEANAQHIVDLLLEQNFKQTLKMSASSPTNDDDGKKTPTDSPIPTKTPDPHDYAVRLSRNAKLIREFVDPGHVTPILVQNKVMTEREADMVHHLHGRIKKWDETSVAFSESESENEEEDNQSPHNDDSDVRNSDNDVIASSTQTEAIKLSTQTQTDDHKPIKEDTNDDDQSKFYSKAGSNRRISRTGAPLDSVREESSDNFAPQR